MEKTVGAFDARRQFGRILQDVAVRGDKVVVERHGEPIAAVVPVHVYEQWKRRREAFFAKMRAVSEQASLSPEEAQRIAAESVQAVRAKQR